MSTVEAVVIIFGMFFFVAFIYIILHRSNDQNDLSLPEPTKISNPKMWETRTHLPLDLGEYKIIMNIDGEDMVVRLSKEEANRIRESVRKI